MKTSKTKTFQKGTDYQDLVDFFHEWCNYELTDEVKMEDTVALSDAKYVITITKITE